jgi:hypothetical protein
MVAARLATATTAIPFLGRQAARTRLAETLGRRHGSNVGGSGGRSKTDEAPRKASAPSPSSGSSSTSLWSQLRAPFLFVSGLYLGLTVLGKSEAREARPSSEYLDDLRAQFVDLDKKR